MLITKGMIIQSGSINKIHQLSAAIKMTTIENFH